MAAALLDPTEDADLSNFFGDSEEGKKFKQEFYTNPRLIKACELVLPFFYNKGAFDV